MSLLFLVGLAHHVSSGGSKHDVEDDGDDVDELLGHMETPRRPINLCLSPEVILNEICFDFTWILVSLKLLCTFWILIENLCWN